MPGKKKKRYAFPSSAREQYQPGRSAASASPPLIKWLALMIDSQYA
jgi:hypothetical protein